MVPGFIVRAHNSDTPGRDAEGPEYKHSYIWGPNSPVLTALSVPGAAKTPALPVRSADPRAAMSPALQMSAPRHERSYASHMH